MRDLVKQNYPVVILLGIFAIGAVLGTCCGINMTLLMTRVLIMALFALSLNLQVGYAGMMNFGHSLFFGLGSYGIMVFASKFGMSYGVSFLLTVVVLAIVAFVCGIIMLNGGSLMTFLFLSFGICLFAKTAFSKWRWIGNNSGLTDIIRPAWMKGQEACFVFVLIVVAICAIIMYEFTRSGFVVMVKGMRENEERLNFLGVDLKKTRVLIYTISSAFAVIAGALYATMNNGAYITSIDSAVSIQGLLMCLIGGSYNFFGPMIGALIVVVINNYLPKLTTLSNSVLAVIIILCCYFMPDGLTGLRVWAGRKRKHMAAAVTDKDA